MLLYLLCAYVFLRIIPIYLCVLVLYCYRALVFKFGRAEDLWG